MGFNNAGLDAYLARLARCPRGPVALGANVGINKEGADPERDYPALIAAVAPHADYAVINVSSPNTPGLRDLQGEAQLRAILRAVAERVPNRPPLLVKIAPDIGDEALAALVETCVAEGVQGLIVVEHHDLAPPQDCAHRWRARPAACPVRRCFRFPPRCWRAHFCSRAAGSC